MSLCNVVFYVFSVVIVNGKMGNENWLITAFCLR